MDQSIYNITQLEIEFLKEALSLLSRVRNATLSMPTARVSEPENGFVTDDAHRRILRRGAGDIFPPFLLLVIEVERLNNNVRSSTNGYVRRSQTARQH